MPINDYADVERISILVSGIGVVVDQDITVTAAELALEWRLPPDACDNLILVELKKSEPALLLEARNDGRKIPSKIVDFCTSLTTRIVDDVTDLAWLQDIGGPISPRLEDRRNLPTCKCLG
jgi:hypothetical protein